MSRLIRGSIGVVLIALVGGGIWLADALVSTSGEATELVDITVERGTSGRELVRLLEEAKVVRHPEVAYWVLRLYGTVNTLKAGTYSVPGDAALLDLPTLLGPDARVKHIVLTLIPGESVWEAAQRMEAAGLTDQVTLLERAADREWVRKNLNLPTGPEREPRTDGVPHTYLEGFLYPETLHFTPGATLETVLQRVTSSFLRVWEDLSTRRKADLLAVRTRYKLSNHQLITLASLVEEESGLRDEAPVVAGVFYNRIQQGMPLQTDPTLVYHPASVGRAPTPRDRKNRDNPYNTYQYKGLPPGPICSPGRFALSAVLTPARHDYLYFVAKRDGAGGHVFARTLDEHRENIRKYLQEPGTHP